MEVEVIETLSEEWILELLRREPSEQTTEPATCGKCRNLMVSVLEDGRLLESCPICHAGIIPGLTPRTG